MKIRIKTGFSNEWSDCILQTEYDNKDKSNLLKFNIWLYPVTKDSHWGWLECTNKCINLHQWVWNRLEEIMKEQ